jgi:hypothetical protein
MEDADKYIEEKDYIQAIEVLIALSKQNPELFEQAQQKIQQIRNVKDSYNNKYDELIRVLFEEENYEQALELIKELDELDKNPNNATKTAIRDARISAELIYYKKIFAEIMDQALVLLSEEKYLDAIQLYETGFDLFRQTFDENPYGDLVKDPVYRAYDELTANLEQIKGDWERYSLSFEEAATLTTAGSANLENLTAQLEDLSQLRNRIYQIALVYDRQNRLIMEGNGGLEDFHLSFMNLLITGRQTSGEWEGITLALDYYIEQGLDRAADSISRQREVQWDAVLADYAMGDWTGASASLDQTDSLTADLEELYSLASARVYLTPARDLDRLGRRISDKYYQSFRENINRIDLITLYDGLISTNELVDNFETDFNGAERDELPDTRENVRSTIDSLIPLPEQLTQWSQSLQEDPLLSEKKSPLIARAADETAALTRRAEILEANIVTSMADQDIITPESLLAEYEIRLATDRDYISGLNEGETNTILLRYPQRALSDLALLSDQMDSLLGDAEDYRDTYRGEQTLIFDGTYLDSYISRINEIIDRAREFKTEMALLQEDGENFIYLAQRDFNAGEFRYNQAERQLNNSNFQLARSELSMAQELYVSALAYDEDSLSRSELDARIADLQARIVDEENKKVIREVRVLINQGKDLYFQGLYAQSESRLIQAENKWFTTNTEDNTELLYWLSLVRTALSVESGRFLEETNPLYNEVTQLLNLARKNYQAGVTFFNNNRRVEGINAMNRADDFLNQILILMPLNQSASVLKLRILKALDEDNFAITFADKYRNALAKADFQKEQAYIELKDLAEIINDYPGIQANILKLEYDLGIKIPPPDPAKLRESTRLYNLARATFDSGNLNQFAGAIEQLSQAIVLNPDNRPALDLIDQIRLYEGGQATAVLPSAALAQYQSAEEKFVQGEYLSSYQIIQELWKNSTYQAYPPLRELKRRVEAQLGI